MDTPTLYKGPGLRRNLGDKSEGSAKLPFQDYSHLKPDPSDFIRERIQQRFSTPPIQSKLSVGKPNDKYEQEADRLATRVVQQINTPTFNPFNQSPDRHSVERNKDREEDKIQAKLTLQPKRVITGGEVSSDLTTPINRARGGGQPLDQGLQKSMGQVMGADFSGVRVHTDGHSDQLNQSLQAKAFTTGQDVFFRQGEYQPSNPGGQELIAHELTHVMQQNRGGVQTMQRKGNPNNDDEGLEKKEDLHGNSLAVKQEASPDERKEAAKNKFIALMEAKKNMNREEIKEVLVDLKTEFSLSDAKLEGDQLNSKIGFYASPATFLPLNTLVIGGQKPVGVASVKAGDYIKATRYDGPFPTPGKEVVDAFDDRFEDKKTTYNNGHLYPSPNKKSKGGSQIYQVQAIDPNNLPLRTKTNNKNYRRAGIVEAKSSVTRHGKRSGGGETLFGHFGADEEVIKTGLANTNYNGGHLVGDQIMDSRNAFNLYEDWNLAPQQRNFNSPVYTSTMENPVTKAINAGATIKYRVTVKYPDDTYNINPSVLVKKLFPNTDPYRKEVEGAINLKKGLDNAFAFRRRTPGFWQAEAEVVPGGKTKINSGKINARPDVAFENIPVNVLPSVKYNPAAPEQVRYSLKTYTNAGWKAQKGPAPKKPLVYNGARKVVVTARQQTF
ncbi:MAG: DUF4157 domain-containing protein [Crocosphaera sp.]|nr:DUF4157 domain-containing protein [Crocosphaera sp.]